MTATGCRFVVIGDVMTDVVAATDRPLRTGTDTPGHVRTSGGGSAANTAHWLAATGHHVTFVGRVGDDPFGAAALDLLRTAGVDLAVGTDPHRATGTCVVLVGPDGERTMIPDAGANVTLTTRDVAAARFARGDHLHLSGYSLLRPESREAALAAVREAAATGMTTSVDAASAGPIADVGAGPMMGWLSGVGVLLANADEAAALTGTGGADPARTARDLAAALGALVVVKLGPDGALSCPPDGEVTRIAAGAGAVVDSTGAGDAFAAGFLPEHLAGTGAAAALRAGADLAGRALQRLGARP